MSEEYNPAAEVDSAFADADLPMDDQERERILSDAEEMQEADDIEGNKLPDE